MVVCALTVALATLTSLVLRRENNRAKDGKKINEGLLGFAYTL